MVNMELTLTDVQDFFEQNKDNEEVANLINGFVTPDRVKNFLDSNEDAAWPILQPKFDKQFEKSLETWKNNNLQGIIDKEIVKRFPDETPEAKRIRELEDKVAKQEADRIKETLKGLATKHCAELGLPLALADACMGESEEIIRAKAMRLETEFKSAVEKTVEDRMSKGYKPKGGQPPMSAEQNYQEAKKSGDPAKLLAAKLGM